MAKKKPAPRTGTKARRTKVAAKLVAGKTQTQTAHELGVSRETVNRDAQAPETRQIVCDLVFAHRAALDALFPHVVAAIADSLTAGRSAVVTEIAYADGKATSRKSSVLDLGADHFARLAGAKRYFELLTLGRPLPKAPDFSQERRTWSLDDILRAVEEAKKRAAGDLHGPLPPAKPQT